MLHLTMKDNRSMPQSDLLSSLSIVRMLDALGKARDECKGLATNWEVKFLAALHAEGFSVQENAQARVEEV